MRPQECHAATIAQSNARLRLGKSNDATMIYSASAGTWRLHAHAVVNGIDAGHERIVLHVCTDPVRTAT